MSRTFKWRFEAHVRKINKPLCKFMGLVHNTMEKTSIFFLATKTVFHRDYLPVKAIYSTVDYGVMGTLFLERHVAAESFRCHFSSRSRAVARTLEKWGHKSLQHKRQCTWIFFLFVCFFHRKPKKIGSWISHILLFFCNSASILICKYSFPTSRCWLLQNLPHTARKKRERAAEASIQITLNIWESAYKIATMWNFLIVGCKLPTGSKKSQRNLVDIL